ncbi:hypothetical protein ACHAPU_008211 [Fusarium lateritium]
MQFSLATIIAALAAIHTADAWKITANSIRECNGAAFFLKTREITGSDTDTTCFTFGQDMPNTGCTELRINGFAGPCNDGGFEPQSIMAEGNCVFYEKPNCAAGSSEPDNEITAVSVRGLPRCMQSEVVDNKIMSFYCF